MKKFKQILCFVTFVLTFSTVLAQSKTTKNEFRFNVGYTFGLEGGGGGLFIFHPEIGWNLNEQFYLGVVSGIETDEKFKTLSIPIYIHPEFSFSTVGRLTPFIGLEGGCVINTKQLADHASNEVSAVINPMIGIKTPIGRSTAFSLSFGYTRFGSGNYLGFKAGVNFGSNLRGFRSIINRSLQSIEIETLTNAKSEADGEYKKERGIFGIRYSLLFPITDNLYLGPSIALGLSKSKYNDGYGEQNGDTNPYGFLQARARYQVRQLVFADRFFPFVQAEAGLGVIDESFFAFGAAVGLSYEVGSDNSIDFTIGYSTYQVEEAGTKYSKNITKGVMRLAIGYSF